MAHYRKIDVSIWNDDKFSSMKNGGKLAYLFLLTHPSMTTIGGMRASVTGLSDEIGMTAKDFNEVFAKGLALFDEKSKCVFLPNFLRYQSSEKINPNIVKGWVKQSSFIPDGIMKELALRNAIFFVKDTPSLINGFNDAFEKETGRTFDEEYGRFFSKESASSLGKISGFLSQRFVDYFTKPLNIKHLAVSKPYQAMNEVGKPPEMVDGDMGVVSAVDSDTGEVLTWVA